MSKFAKLFDLENDLQVIIIRDFNSIDNCPIIIEQTKINGIMARLTHEFNTEESCNLAFQEYDLPRAKAFLLQMKIAVDDSTGKTKIEGTTFTKN